MTRRAGSETGQLSVNGSENSAGSWRREDRQHRGELECSRPWTELLCGQMSDVVHFNTSMITCSFIAVMLLIDLAAVHLSGYEKHTRLLEVLGF